MKKKITARVNISLLLSFVLISTLCSTRAFGVYKKINPPPDVDKSAHGHTGTNTCWLATAANMLAGAGYGTGSTVQARADNIYTQLTAHYGTGPTGWTDTAISWWLQSSHNTWTSNQYTVTTVYGNKSPKYPWADPNGAQFIGNELRRCQYVGLSESWPSSTGIGTGGHAIAVWGDDGDANMLITNPNEVIVSDSDSDVGGDLQTYTYDSYTNPNPGGINEGNGWYIDYSSNHPYIKHIITLCPPGPSGGGSDDDDPQPDPADPNDPNSKTTQKVTGSYKIHQDNNSVDATDLHFLVGTDVNILGYNITVDWNSGNEPNISIVDNPYDPAKSKWLKFDWDFSDNPMPYCTWITITVELVLPRYNLIVFEKVYFTYPSSPSIAQANVDTEIRSSLIDPASEPNSRDSNTPNICGGYVVAAFDLYEDPGGLQPVGNYRMLHEYDYFEDPELHDFILQRTPSEPTLPYTVHVGNFRFGHSYGKLDTDALWQFDQWLPSEDVPIMPFDPGVPIVINLNWEGLLPYPPGEDYIPPAEPTNCGDPGTIYLPEDLNFDCYVDFRDFTLMANVWLNCTDPNNIACGGGGVIVSN